jgi:sulfotransferase
VRIAKDNVKSTRRRFVSTTKPQPLLEYSDDVHAELRDDLRTTEQGYKFRLIDGIVMPAYVTPSCYELSRTLETRADDICYTGYPKSGTNWLANILVRLVNNGGTPEDKTLRESLHWVESSIHFALSRKELDALPSPRIFSSHMPFQMAFGGDPLKNPCRYVYIARNPKDVAVSYFHFETPQLYAGDYDGAWAQWLQMFVEGGVHRGDWFDHVLGWWAHRDANNVHFMKYEDLSNDFGGELRRLGRFLGKELPDELVHSIEESTVFRNMKQDRFSCLQEIPGMRHLYRKGQVGSWKEQFTVRQSDWFDELYQKRMQGTGLDFQFE